MEDEKSEAIQKGLLISKPFTTLYKAFCEKFPNGFLGADERNLNNDTIEHPEDEIEVILKILDERLAGLTPNMLLNLGLNFIGLDTKNEIYAYWEGRNSQRQKIDAWKERFILNRGSSLCEKCEECQLKMYDVLK